MSLTRAFNLAIVIAVAISLPMLAIALLVGRL